MFHFVALQPKLFFNAPYNAKFDPKNQVQKDQLWTKFSMVYFSYIDQYIEMTRPLCLVILVDIP